MRAWTRLAGSEPWNVDCHSFVVIARNRLAVLLVLAQHCDIYISVKIQKIDKVSVCGVWLFFGQVHSGILLSFWTS